MVVSREVCIDIGKVRLREGLVKPGKEGLGNREARRSRKRGIKKLGK